MIFVNLVDTTILIMDTNEVGVATVDTVDVVVVTLVDAEGKQKFIFWKNL
jgi:hypothetical protein